MIKVKDTLWQPGYWKAFQTVKEIISDILQDMNPGEAADIGNCNWYRDPLTPCAVVGILKAFDLAGYRTNQVYIKGSKRIT